jgi:signal transduction histidine kinase
MFAVGLNLQGAMELVAEPAGQQRLEHAIQQVDRIITEIRAFVFEVASTQPPQDQPAC